MANLDSRIRALEAAAAPKLVYVVTIRADGTVVPLNPGEQYSRYVVEMPEVCKSADEWLERVRAEGMI